MDNITANLIEEVVNTISSLLKSKIPVTINVPEDAGSEITQLCELCNILIEKSAEAKDFLGSLSNGDLDSDPPRRNFFISPLKQLHANLRHLQWQTLQIAKGDLNQQVDFLGEFSVAFNSLITSLRQKQKVEEELRTSKENLYDKHEELKKTQSQMLQSEKMASIGQLAAGVAHEINNPMGFIASNLGSMDKYVKKLVEFINAQAEVVEQFSTSEEGQTLKKLRKSLKVDYIVEDIEDLVTESLDGANRVKEIVQNLKTFSRVDQTEFQTVNINDCIESTLNIAWNDLKYKVTLDKEYGELPPLSCFPQQLNQVILNLLVNAGQAIDEKGTIKIRTWVQGERVYIRIADTGAGIPEDKLDKIFEPFFTTKVVGEGTGLGLSISYDIVKNHNGEITVQSKVGEGTAFTIMLPISQESD